MRVDFALLPCLLALSLCCSGLQTRAFGAGQGDLKGSIEKQETGSDKKSKTLEGGVKDEASLKPHLDVIPGNQGKPAGTPMGTGITQYAGGSPYKPGQPLPYPIYRPPSGPSPHIRTYGGTIPPVSTYTLTPRTGIMTFGPTYQTRFESTGGGTISVGSFSTSTPPRSSYKGISTYGDADEIKITTSRNGIMTWSPGFGVYSTGSLPMAHASTTISGISTYRPGYEVKEVPGTKGIRSYSPGYEVAVKPSRKGIIAYSPGYEVAVSVPGLIRSSLGGNWSAGSPGGDGGLSATPIGMPANMIFAQSVFPRALDARPLLLDGVAAEPVAENWQEWYTKTAAAIYSRWQYAAVGPGVARVRVTVTASRDIVGQVEDFTPAEGVERNVPAETEFREAALRSVNLLSRFEIPSFPRGSAKSQVVFTVDMKRTVDGAAGFDVARAAIQE